MGNMEADKPLSEDSKKEIRESARKIHELNVYLLVSIGMQCQFRVPTPHGVMEPLPFTDDEGKLNELGQTVREAVFGNPWYGSTGREMIDAYIEQQLGEGALFGPSLVDTNSVDSRGYELTEQGERVLENVLDKHEQDPAQYPHVTAILENIRTANAA